MADQQLLIDTYVKQASAIPEVQMIFLTGSPGEESNLLTVIDAPRFDRATEHRIFSAELDAMDAADNASIAFHLVNLQTIPGHLEDHLPPRKRLLFRREHVA